MSVDERPPVQHLSRVLASNAQRFPDRTALRFKSLGIWQTVTWAAYLDSVEQIARGLIALGVEAGGRVAIQSENRPEWVFVDLAACALRAVTVGIYPTNPTAEVTYLLQDSGARVVFAEDQEQVDKALEAEPDCPELQWIVALDRRGLSDDAHPKLISLDELIERGERLPPSVAARRLADAERERTDDDLVALVYTSGTTGPPKGAMLTARNVSFAADVFSRPGGILGGRIDDREVLLSYLPLSHVVERGISVWVHLRARTVVHFAESIDTVIADLADVQPTILFAVPRIWEKIQASISIRMANASWVKRQCFALGAAWGRRIAADRVARGGRPGPRARILTALGYWPLYRPLRKRLGLLRVRHAISGAAPLAPEVLTFFLGLGVPLHEAYGMTENSAVATSNLVGRMRVGTVGEAHPDAEVRLAEGTNEVLTRHPGNFAGYWERPDATAEAIDADGWLHTGDVGAWVDGTHLRIVDRIKDIIITAGGKNVSPSEIENSLKSSPYVKEAVVIGDQRPYLVAIIGIELDTVADWATRAGVEFTTYRDLSSRPEVVALISEVVRGANTRLSRVESVRKFRMLVTELDHEGGELTATQKLKRAVFARSVPHLIDDMYAGTELYPGADLGRNG